MINKHLISRLRRVDWDFAGLQSNSLFSALHWHPGRFMSQLPATLIGLLSQPGDVVLDPFAGSGTTLVEAQRLGRVSIGIDIGEISCKIIKAKTLTLGSGEIGALVKKMQNDAKNAISSTLNSSKFFSIIPENVQADKWYTKKVQKNLGMLWNLISTYTGSERILSEVAFSAILLPICRETRHWGYVCDNSAPKDDNEGDVYSKYCKILDDFFNAYKERDRDREKRFGEGIKIEKAEIYCGDTAQILNKFKAESIDLVVTSPPYFGVCDYIKAQRLSMEWFGYPIEEFRKNEVGARSKRHRKTAIKDYIEEITSVFKCIRKCIKQNGVFVVIIGESSTREPILDKIKDALKKTNFKIHLDLNRRISTQRRQTPSINNEHIYVLLNE